MTLSMLEAAMLRECLERLGQLEARVAALEASARRDPLHERNAAARAEGERLRHAIRAILADDSGAMTAKQVLRELSRMDIDRAQLPSLRTVRWHIAAIRRQRQCSVLPPG